MNIIKHELKSNLKAFLIWMGALFLVMAAASTEYTAFTSNPDMLDLLDSFKSMFDALGIPLVDLGKPEGFLAMMSIYLYMPVSIYAAILGSSIISKEERDKTAEYLFTLPVSRQKVLASKIITAFTFLVIFIITLLLIATIIFSRFGLEATWYNFMFYMSIALIFTGGIFMSIGMLLSSYLKQYKRSGGIVVILVVVTFMLNILVGLVEELDFLKYFIPFQYFLVEDILNSKIQFIFIVLSFVIMIPSVFGTFYFYKKRDLYI
ncbi:ABC transporter permease [Candidatus Izimaplasma bacterium]|nr:ABC transporter permease [Candidatus Izimaplasma bacterium]